MKSQSLVLLVIAAGCGLVAMFGVQKVMSRNSVKAEDTIEVLQASVDIQPGDVLNDTNTKLVRVNVNACPEGVVRDPKEIAERSIKVPATIGDWILVSKLSEKGEVGAAPNVPDGMRALAIPVDATQTLSGMLRPGNRVDIMLTYESKTHGGKRQITRTILQYVEVFAVDDKIYGKDRGTEVAVAAKNISVLVTPEQAGLLRLAEKVGTLSTSLRSNGDKTEVANLEITDETLSKELGGIDPDAKSVMSIREELEGGSGVIEDEIPQDNPPIPPSITEQLQAEAARNAIAEVQATPEPVDPGGSMPVLTMKEPEPPKNLWSIEIREGSTVRMETVELPEEKKESSGSGSFWDFLKKGNG
ncbi:MAG: Flp pilus assembly protein CpaB [Planctomyces sp.]|nr:Flp pilus assembly protein CpaB [Planctomyces sp.]